jgi:glucose dehydrogenase
MRSQLPGSSTQSSLSISKCAIALLWCAFSIETLYAQTLNWPYYGNDVYNLRFQNIDQINLSNVAQLKPPLTFHTGVLGDPNMSTDMTPIVVNNMMFITTRDDDVFALNPTTGAQIWQYKPTGRMRRQRGKLPEGSMRSSRRGTS